MVESHVVSISPATHGDRHSVGGVDPLITPVLIDPHKTTHEPGGTDVISVVTAVDTQVYNAAKAAAWANLDLTAVVGTGDGVVMILVENDSGGVSAIRFRPDGRTENIYVSSEYGSASVCYLSSGANGKGIIIVPHLSGIIEWASSNAGGTITLTVLAFW